ncbi:MAG: hypothetical protein IH624_04775 [Phycisphaerae bacterium]|nr:hypothetical protein [Phycisphaerae bacterium]
MHSHSARDRRSGGSKRSAITLIEVLVLLTILVVITNFTMKMVRTFASDVPRSYRDFQTNMTVQDMLRQLRRDVEGALDLQRLPNDEATNPVLAVTLSEGIVYYEFFGDKVARGLTAGDPGEEGLRVWRAPHAMLEWQVLASGNKAYAMEITTAIERVVLARHERKLRNAHVFFLGLANGAESENTSE